MRVDPCSVPYPNVKTPHLHPLPFHKGSEKLRTPETAEVVRHHPPAFECGSLCASRFLEAGPETTRHVTILTGTLPEAIVIVRDTRVLLC